MGIAACGGANRDFVAILAPAQTFNAAVVGLQLADVRDYLNQTAGESPNEWPNPESCHT